MAKIVNNTGAWVHLWSWSDDGGNKVPPSGTASVPAEVEKEVQRLRKEAALLQSANDKLRNQQLRDGGNGRSEGKNGKGKQDKGGKGKGGSSGDRERPRHSDRYRSPRRDQRR